MNCPLKQGDVFQAGRDFRSATCRGDPEENVDYAELVCRVIFARAPGR
jgi:hypothetical protein